MTASRAPTLTARAGVGLVPIALAPCEKPLPEGASDGGLVARFEC